MEDFEKTALTSTWTASEILEGDFWIDRLLLGNLARRAVYSVLLFGLAPLAVFLCARQGDLLRLQSPDFGFLQDYVMLGFFVTVPLQLYITMFCARKFAEFFNGLPRVLKKNRFQLDEYNRDVNDILLAVQGRGRARAYYGVLLIGGIVAFAVNASALYVRPGAWNSGAHFPSFIASQAYYLIVLVFVYPSIVYKFLAMLYGVWRICRTTKEKRAFKVWPLAPDGAGGLRKLGDITIALNYFLVPYVVLMVLQKWTVGHSEGSVSFGFLIGAIFFVPVQVSCFFMPLGAAHEAMKESKEEVIETISVALERANRAMIEALSSQERDTCEDVLKIEEEMSSLRRMYDIVAELPIWPFDARIFGRLLSNILLPVTGTLVAMLVERYLG